jgi:hypothetical protein
MFVWYGCDCGRVVVADDDDNSGWMKSDGGDSGADLFK